MRVKNDKRGDSYAIEDGVAAFDHANIKGGDGRVIVRCEEAVPGDPQPVHIIGGVQGQPRPAFGVSLTIEAAQEIVDALNLSIAQAKSLCQERAS